MEKRFVVKNFETGLYLQYAWDEKDVWGTGNSSPYYFDTREVAKDFISRRDGKFQIETIYII